MMRQLAAFLTIPLIIGLSPIVGWFFGQWLDKKWDTFPVFTLLLIFLGLFAGFREVYRIIKRFGNGV
ncbi:MAG: AtpZ/AtpI family protein [Parachlamydiaceae bacterium]|nr:AtpZ/AtpI family protein [Parachlamydiaceae bacterium]